jgi:hypothetical protein
MAPAQALPASGCSGQQQTPNRDCSWPRIAGLHLGYRCQNRNWAENSAPGLITMPALASSLIVRQPRHPSRLPFGSRSLGLDWSRRLCRSFPLRAKGRIWLKTYPRAAADKAVTERERSKRRILLSFVRSGLRTQPAFSVRGGSRRIIIMRFRPADIRVIHRRSCFSSWHALSPPARGFRISTKPG